MDDEQALWEVATALGSEFDADHARTRAHATAALVKLVETDTDEPSPLDREWRDGMAAATVGATVKLLAAGQLDSYLSTGEHAGGAAEAIAKMAPLPEPKDLVFANTMLDKLYARRHPAG
jgi:hypothetical protein